MTVAVFALAACSGDGEPTRTFQLEAWGNVMGAWGSDDKNGKLDLYSGHDQQTVQGKAVTISVMSTMPSGARCVIRDESGKVLDDQSARPAAGTSGLAASTSVVCSAPLEG